MKIVHTSDWHIGRRWKGIQRLDELEAVLDHLAAFIQEQSIDLVLHTGDVFESRNPPAEAEQLVNRFLVRVGRSGAQMVVIAGNHDDPLRLDARSLLTELVNVQIIGRPRPAFRGGTRIVETRSGEKAVVAALPFASPGAWVSALDLAGEEASARRQYALMFERAVQDLCGAFLPDAVNILMAHTHLEGALFGESERRVHIGDDWAASPESLPSTATYIALGHIHRPQQIKGPVPPTYYAGSLLQMDFGEAGEEKTFTVVTASSSRSGRRAKAEIEHLPYEGGLPLVDLRASLAELEETADRYRTGWLRVTVPLTERDPDLNRKVRELLPNALVVRAELPEVEEPPDIRLETGVPPVKHYAAYHLRTHQEAAPLAVLDTFQDLYDQAFGED
ncbi:MAG TPA: exonuclease SbcCD subunit D [Thermoanaerobaculia bacterium]|jgi:exonuclease SbcD|nr:exonuclease SbcCD subunit D [Thermoanaerobaculia bacterium]